MVKEKLTDLRGNRLLQNDFINTFCEIRNPSEPGWVWVSEEMPTLNTKT